MLVLESLVLSGWGEAGMGMGKPVGVGGCSNARLGYKKVKRVSQSTKQKKYGS